MCNELLLQTFMSKLILRKEINKLYLNTVLKIFIRQYRTRAGNHGNCCFIIIFVNGHGQRRTVCLVIATNARS